jgi:hypothetical protein
MFHSDLRKESEMDNKLRLIQTGEDKWISTMNMPTAVRRMDDGSLSVALWLHGDKYQEIVEPEYAEAFLAEYGVKV